MTVARIPKNNQTAACLFGTLCLFFLSCEFLPAQSSSPASSNLDSLAENAGQFERPDCDGDGIPDSEDKHPLLPVKLLSWEIGEFTVGWSLDSRIDIRTISTSTKTLEVIKSRKKTFGDRAKAGATAYASGGVSGTLSLNPLDLVSHKGTYSAGLSANLSGETGIAYLEEDLETAKELESVLSSAEVSTSLSNLSVEFTVLFRNFQDFDFSAKDIELQMMRGNSVLANAVYNSATGDRRDFTYPGRAGQTETSNQVPCGN